MRHQAAVVVCRRLAKEKGLDLGAPTRALGARRRGGVVPVVPATSAVPAARVAPVARATSADPAVPAVRATSADPAVPVAPATSVVPLVRVTSVDPVVPATLDRDLLTPSEASVVPRGVMEQRRGAGEHLREPGGADPFRRPAASGTKGRSTTGATTRHRYGIRAKTAGASISSESGSRSNESAHRHNSDA
jgi:hypothetical protein